MDIGYYKQFEPLFGSWSVAQWLGRAGCGDLFELTRREGGAVQTATLKAVFIPGKGAGIRQLMSETGAEEEPSAFLRRLAETTAAEISALTGLKGKPGIPVCEAHLVWERADKTGVDVLLWLESLVPLAAFRARRPLQERDVLRMGADLCAALESCQQAGLAPPPVTPENVWVTPEGGFRLGNLGQASGSGQNAGDSTAASLCALVQLLQAMTADLAGLSPRFSAFLRSAGSDPALGQAGPAEMRRRLGSMLPAGPDAAAHGPDAAAHGPDSAAPKAADPVNRPPAGAAADRSALRPPVRRQPMTETARQIKVPPVHAPDPVSDPAPAGLAPALDGLKEMFRAAAPGPAEGSRQSRGKGQRLGGLAAALACLALAALVAGGFFLYSRHAAADPSAAGSASPAPDTSAAAQEPPEPTPAPTPSAQEAAALAREERIQHVLSAVQDNCTGSEPQITDPDTWAAAGKALMDRLEADPYYQEQGFTASAAAFAAGAQDQRSGILAAISQWQQADAVTLPEQYPYLLAVNRAASTVTVYVPDAEGRYTVPYMAMVCSGGPDTPTGFWFTPINYQWRTLVGPCYGQNATRIWSSYLFHSVPYYSQHKDDLEYDEFNLLGTPASLGCIRLAMVDVKWIFDNCPIGTPVVIYDDQADPGPMGKPGTIYTDPADRDLRGWDPTDPDPANPWDDHYLSGTSIRSDAAWEEFNAALLDGRWAGTVNPTDLQGWSTDSSVAGTRG